MKNYFIAIFPDQKAARQMLHIQNQVKDIFSSQEIPIRWINAEKLHVTIVYVGRDLNIIHKQLLKMQVKAFAPMSFRISTKSVKLGVSNRYRELLYFSINEGANELRDTLINVTNKLKIKREEAFIPHISLGRVGKDLTDEEYRNLQSQIEAFNRRGFDEIVFSSNKPVLVESDLTDYRVIS